MRLDPDVIHIDIRATHHGHDLTTGRRWGKTDLFWRIDSLEFRATHFLDQPTIGVEATVTNAVGPASVVTVASLADFERLLRAPAPSLPQTSESEGTAHEDGLPLLVNPAVMHAIDDDFREAVAAARGWFELVDQQPDGDKLWLTRGEQGSGEPDDRRLTHLTWRIRGYRFDATHCQGLLTIGVRMWLTPLSGRAPSMQVNTKERLERAIADTRQRETEIAWSSWESPA
jgi:hypothetical protein